MRRIALLAALSLLAHPAEASETAVAFGLEECRYVEAIVRVPAEAVAAEIPSDLTLMVQGGLATVNVGGASCARATSDLGDGEASFGWMLAAIAPPADLTLRGTTPRVWFYRLAHWVVPGDAYDAVAVASGAERVSALTIVATVAPAASSLRVGTAEGVHEIDVPVSPPDGGIGGDPLRWRELHRVDGGYAVLEATLAPDPSAATTVASTRPASASSAASVLGPLNAGLGLYGTAYAIEDAWMDLIPWP